VIDEHNERNSELGTCVPPLLASTASQARVLDRNTLFAALAQAVRPDSPRSLLAVFGFEGLKEYLDAASDAAGANLLEMLGGRLVTAVGETGLVYTSRRGEFCAIFEGGIGAVRSLLAVIPSELDDDVRSFGIRSSLGIAVLPDEATLPTYALALADRRLRALSGDLRREHA